jgi:hypothetical protein
MDVVLGEGALAEGIAAALGKEGPTRLVGPPMGTEAATLWRWADLDSGEGVGVGVRGADRVYFVLERPRAAHGALAALEKLGIEDGVAVGPIGTAMPQGLDRWPGWSRVEVGPIWGPTEPLVARWSALVASGQHVWLADPGPIAALALPDAVAAVRAAVTLEGARWRLTSPGSVRLPQLADALAVFHDRPLRATRVPLRFAMRAISLDPGRIREWLAAPAAPPETPGWKVPQLAGPAGWVTGLRRSKAA